MANKKLSDMTVASTLALTDLFYVQQGTAAGTERKVTLQGLFDAFGATPRVISVSSSSTALRVTQTGSGNALVVEDSTNPDGSPFVVDSGGAVGVGVTTPQAGVAVHVGKALTGATTAQGYRVSSVVSSDVTVTAYGFKTALATATAAFTLGQLSHFAADLSALGAGSTITTQYGFAANASLIGATSNMGFYGNIPAATGRWNAYMGGTAQNYFAGNVGIGIDVPTGKLDVNDNKVRVRTAQTPASATATGNQGEIAWDSGFVYVCVATNTWKRAALTTW